ncbi:MAG: PDZ domain-containing protein [Candidatus Aegiribacteria sp.]|nr:PDZ domain-containing protein [Candidatus Aegiribacteria sp.]
MYCRSILVLMLIVLKTSNVASDDFSTAVSFDSAVEAATAIETLNPDAGFDLPGAVLLEDSVLYADSVYRHFYYAVPLSYESGTPAPLMMWLHGGVSTQELSDYEPEVLTEWHLIPGILDMGCILVFPCAQSGAVWWDLVGQQGIMDIIATLKHRLNIDDSRVFVGGFSDGASGSWALMMLQPSPFAGYLAFSGHLGVAAIHGDRATYLSCLSNRPGIASHTDDDGLYPSSVMAPSVELAQEAGAEIAYHTFEGYGHDADYLPLLEEDVMIFIDTTFRERFPEHLIWRTGEPSGCDWLMVDSIIPWPVLTEDTDHNMVLVSERLTIGFMPDWEAEGDGIPVAQVLDGDTPANRIELKADDVIIGFQDCPVMDLEDLFEVMSEMSPGDHFTMNVDRGGEQIHLTGNFNPPEYYWLFPRSKPSVRVDAVYAGNFFDIEVNRLCVLRLLLHPDMIDPDREVTVLCNGIEIYRGFVEMNSEMAIDTYARTGDRQRPWAGELVLDLEELMLPRLANP